MWQVMKYGGRVLDFMEDLGAVAPVNRFLEVLAEARSNIPAMGNGADVYRAACSTTPRHSVSHHRTPGYIQHRRRRP